MGPIKESLREKLYTGLFGWEEIDADFQKILVHIIKHGGLGILDPWFSAESVYNTSKASSGVLLGYLLGGTALNYVYHSDFVRRDSTGARKEHQHVDIADLDT